MNRVSRTPVTAAAVLDVICARETAAWREMSFFASTVCGGQISFLEAEALWRMCRGIKPDCKGCSALGSWYRQQHCDMFVM